MFRRLVHSNVILCDTCKYNYRTACTNPDRPNATDCDDYVRQ